MLKPSLGVFCMSSYSCVPELLHTRESHVVISTMDFVTSGVRLHLMGDSCAVDVLDSLEYWCFEILVILAGLLPNPELELATLSVWCAFKLTKDFPFKNDALFFRETAQVRVKWGLTCINAYDHKEILCRVILSFHHT